MPTPMLYVKLIKATTANWNQFGEIIKANFSDGRQHQ